jgi:hypothetical protein
MVFAHPHGEGGIAMKPFLAATALALSTLAATSTPSAASSDTIGGGPVYSPAQAYLYCFFTNLGTSKVTIESEGIYESNSTSPLGIGGLCAVGSAVVPHQTCYVPYFGLGGNGNALSCSVTFTSSAENVRGTLNLYDANNNLLVSADLR